MNRASPGFDVVATVEFLEADGDAEIPASVLGAMIGGLFDFHREHPAGLDVLHQQRVVVSQEEIEELLLVAPLDLVIIILHRIRMVGGLLRRRAL